MALARHLIVRVSDSKRSAPRDSNGGPPERTFQKAGPSKAKALTISIPQRRWRSQQNEEEPAYQPLKLAHAPKEPLWVKRTIYAVGSPELKRQRRWGAGRKKGGGCVLDHPGLERGTRMPFGFSSTPID